MSFLAGLLQGGRSRNGFRPLYDRIVALGRDPSWYREGRVPDTVDGRFDMISAVLTIVLLRLEAGDAEARSASVLLTETFIDDMDGSLRQIGIGDLLVGKHVGRMMSALGGRLTAFRAAFSPGGDLYAAVIRNIFHEEAPSGDAVAFVSGRLASFQARVADLPVEHILRGELPTP